MPYSTEEKTHELMEYLKEKGYKTTRAREELIRVFVETQDHLKPEDVHRKLKAEHVSLPTVYRSIDLLKKLGIIKEISIADERYYELYRFSQKKLHIHFQCISCGKIKEYDDRHVISTMLNQKEYIEKNYGDQIEDITIVTKGICQECKKREE